jgi:transcriptional regulator with XRE-family HTH domain
MTPKQCKAARALLGWTQWDLSKAAHIANSTLADFERGKRELLPENLVRVEQALLKGGIANQAADFATMVDALYLTELARQGKEVVWA